MKTKSALVAACLLGLALHGSAQTNPVILFSGSANGMLRSCHCPNAPWGGLAKRAWLVDEIRRIAGPENVLLLDAGDLLPLEAEPERTAVVLDLYRLMRYDAVAIGDQDLPYRMAQAAAAFPADFPWLSDGYRLTNGPSASPAPACKIFKIAGLRVGVVSVVGSEAFRFSPDKRAGVEMTDPTRQVASFISRHGASCDLVVALSHQGEESDRLLAAAVEGLDLIIGGHSQSLITPPAVVNGTLIAQAGKNGENLGVLMLRPKRPGAAEANPAGTPPADPFAVTAAEGLRWRAVQRLIPMNAAVDESEAAAALVTGYDRLQDGRVAARLKSPAPPAAGQPRLAIAEPFPYLVLRAGETGRVQVLVANAGEAPLVVEKARSKIAWLAVTNDASPIAPGATGAVEMAVAAVAIDRFFRSEYSLTTSDKTRIVVGGSVNGRVEGPIPGILDMPALMSGMTDLLKEGTEPVSEPPRPADPAPPEAVVPPPVPVPVLDVAPTNRAEPAAVAPAAPLKVEFFFAAGCEDCEEVKSRIQPDILKRFGPAVSWESLDIAVPGNYLRLARLQEKLGVRTSENVSVYVADRIHIGGIAAIRSGLADAIDALLQGREPDPSAPPPAVVPPAVVPSPPPEAGGAGVLEKRLSRFTVWTVGAAGLVDGFNPCAFSTIIFFMSWLAATGVRSRKLAWVGAGYLLATFFTYSALGFGLLQALKAIQGYRLAGDVLKGLMLLALAVLALLSFRDAWRFRKTGQAGDVTLQLPEGVKRRIHQVMRTRLASGSLFLGAAAIGFLVTLLESVCTGQVYVPTLALMARESAHQARALSLLALYNAAFVIPLAAVLLAAFLGARNRRLLDWSARNVVWSKCAMGLLFAVLALVLAWG